MSTEILDVLQTSAFEIVSEFLEHLSDSFLFELFEPASKIRHFEILQCRLEYVE